MGFPEYEGPVIVTQLRPGVIMVRPATEAEVAEAAAKAAPKADDAAPATGAGIGHTDESGPDAV